MCPDSSDTYLNNEYRYKLTLSSRTGKFMKTILKVANVI